jgi:hypothetical protein
MASKLGSLSHAKGFIINKLFNQNRIGGSHVQVEVLPHGYPPKWRHMIPAALDELKREGIVKIQRKRTGRGYSDHVTLVVSKLRVPSVRGLLNAYLRSRKLPTLGRDLKTWIPY